MDNSTDFPSGPTAVRIPAALLSAERLTEAQLDGHACVVCGRNYLAELDPTPSMPVGVVDDGQVFACAVPCAAPVEIVHKVLLPIRGAVVGVCGAKEGKAVAGPQGVTCPGCLAEVERLAAPPAVEEVELIRADDLAVVEVVRAAGTAPAVRLTAGGRVDTWTANRALLATAVLVDVAERQIKEDPEDAEWFMGAVLNVVEALITAARLVRAEIEAAA